MRVLLTGATGFIGKAILDELQNKGFEVFPVGGPRSRNIPTDSRPITCDVADPDDVLRLTSMRDIDAVVHAAGLAHRFTDGDPKDFVRTNVDGVRNVAQVAVKLGAKQFLLLSSVLVYGDVKSSPTVNVTEEFPCLPKDIYGESKLLGEQAAQEVCEKHSLSLTILRLAPTIGEGSKGNFSKLVRAMDRRMFLWVGRGENRKSLVYVGDAGRAVETILRQKKEGIEIFNVAAKPRKMNEIVGEIASSIGHNIPKVSLPPAFLQRVLSLIYKAPLMKWAGHANDTIRKWCSEEIYSAEKLKDEYGFTPDTDILEAVRRDVKFYLQYVKRKARG